MLREACDEGPVVASVSAGWYGWYKFPLSGGGGWATAAWPTAVRARGKTAGCSPTGAALSDCKSITPGWECPMWGYSCSQMCGNGKVNDGTADNAEGDNTRPTDGSEECDLGTYNVDIRALSAAEKWLYPCTHLCKWNRELTLNWGVGAGSHKQ